MVPIGVFYLQDMSAGSMAGEIFRLPNVFLRSLYKKHVPTSVFLNPEILGFEESPVVQFDKCNSD